MMLLQNAFHQIRCHSRIPLTTLSSIPARAGLPRPIRRL